MLKIERAYRCTVVVAAIAAIAAAAIAIAMMIAPMITTEMSAAMDRIEPEAAGKKPPFTVLLSTVRRMIPHAKPPTESVGGQNGRDACDKPQKCIMAAGGLRRG